MYKLVKYGEWLYMEWNIWDGIWDGKSIKTSKVWLNVKDMGWNGMEQNG